MFNSRYGNQIASSAQDVPYVKDSSYRKHLEETATRLQQIVDASAPVELSIAYQVRSEYPAEVKFIIGSIEEADAIRDQLKGTKETPPFDFIYIVDLEKVEYTIRAACVIGICVKKIDIVPIVAEIAKIKEHLAQ